MITSQVPGGVTKKEICKKCGRPFFARLVGSSMKTTTECSICNPEVYSDKQEEKKK